MKTKQMRKILTVGVMFISVGALSACETASRALSGEKKAPDEFAVFARPPLSLPPEFNLRPPTPNQKAKRGRSPESLAREALLGKSADTQPNASDGVQSLLENTGANKASPEIRKIISEESTIVAQEDDLFINKLIFWVDDKPYEGRVIDPNKEQKRLQENQALGKPVTDGDVPVIKRKSRKKGLLDF